MSVDQFFLKISSPGAAIAALVVFVISSVVFAKINPKKAIAERLGDKYFSTDTTFGYTPDNLYVMLQEYDHNDRAAHYSYTGLDLIYPCFYAIPWAIITACLMRTFAVSANCRIHYLMFVPIAVAVFDYLENFSMLGLVLMLPARSNSLAWFSTGMTMVKLVLIYAVFFLFTTGVIKLVFGPFANKMNFPP